MVHPRHAPHKPTPEKLLTYYPRIPRVPSLHYGLFLEVYPFNNDHENVQIRNLKTPAERSFHL